MKKYLIKYEKHNTLKAWIVMASNEQKAVSLFKIEIGDYPVISCVEFGEMAFVKINDIKNRTVEWTPEIVYKVYCKDDLNTLPVSILEDMKKYVEAIILDKLNEVE